MSPEPISINKNELTRSGYVTYIAILTNLSMSSTEPLSVIHLHIGIILMIPPAPPKDRFAEKEEDEISAQ